MGSSNPTKYAMYAITKKNNRLAQEEYEKESQQYIASIVVKPQLFIDVIKFSTNESCCYLSPKSSVILWMFEEFQLYNWIDLNLQLCSSTAADKNEKFEKTKNLESCVRYESQIVFANVKLLQPDNAERELQVENDIEINVKDSCARPFVYIYEKQLTICGLTSVTRFLIRFVAAKRKNSEIIENDSCYSYEQLIDLLGHRGGCLQSCTEVSTWTKFCELDMVNSISEAIKKLGNNNALNNTDSEISQDLIIFEHHLKLPVRIHNIGKEMYLKQKQIKSEKKIQNGNTSATEEIDPPKLEHDYAEGPYMRLPDLLLFPCVYLFLDIYGEELFAKYLPMTLRWVKKLDTMFKLTESKKLRVFHLDQTFDITNLKVKEGGSQYICKVPEIIKSLRKSDRARYNPKTRLFTRPNDVQEALNAFSSSEISTFEIEEETSNVNWDEIPLLAQPEGGRLPEKRQEKKCQQLSSMAIEVMKVVKEKHGNNSPSFPLRIVDFCSGGGHLGILLAFLLPECQIILVENKEESLRRGSERVEKLGLTNVAMYQCNLDYFDGQFDIGVALHACGSATDLVLSKCIGSNASFVCCPCCYGAIQSNHMLRYPRSSIFERNISLKHYLILAHSSDQTHDEKHEKTQQGKQCMRVIDTDRCLNAQQSGYQVCLTKIVPETASPKNHILVGISISK